MAFIPAPNVAMAEIRMGAAGQDIENTLYFKDSVAGDPPNLTDLGNDLLIWWNTLLAVALPVEVTLREIYLTDLSSATAPTHTQPAPAPAPTGDKPGPILPNNASLCVSFRTNARGRSFRGRNYLAGLTEPDVVQSTVSSGLLVDTLAAYNGLLTAPMTTRWEWVIVSRFSNKLPRAVAAVTPVTSVVIVDPVVDSMRRRLPGRGR